MDRSGSTCWQSSSGGPTSGAHGRWPSSAPRRRAVTREGQVRSGERHEKDDRHRVDDPRRWVLGWANERKIAALRAELAELDRERLLVSAELAELTGRRDSVQWRREALARLDGFQSWSDLDVAEAESRAEGYDAERARLEAGSSRLEEITRALARNAELAAATDLIVEDLTGRLATTAATVRQARQDKARDDDYVRSQPDQELTVARASYGPLAARLGSSRPGRSADCGQAETELSAELHRRIERLTRELGGYGQSLGQYMSEVLRRWPELRADMDVNVESRGDFVALRERVATDDLPRFESEFKDQLNKNAIQELAGFNNWLNRAGISHRRTGFPDQRGARSRAIQPRPLHPSGEGTHQQLRRGAVPRRPAQSHQ